MTPSSQLLVTVPGSTVVNVASYRSAEGQFANVAVISTSRGNAEALLLVPSILLQNRAPPAPLMGPPCSLCLYPARQHPTVFPPKQSLE